MEKYHVEVTDTFGGEPNYCWGKSYIVAASSPQGACVCAFVALRRIQKTR